MIVGSFQKIKINRNFDELAARWDAPEKHCTTTRREKNSVSAIYEHQDVNPPL